MTDGKASGRWEANLGRRNSMTVFSISVVVVGAVFKSRQSPTDLLQSGESMYSLPSLVFGAFCVQHTQLCSSSFLERNENSSTECLHLQTIWGSHLVVWCRKEMSRGWQLSDTQHKKTHSKNATSSQEKT